MADKYIIINFIIASGIVLDIVASQICTKQETVGRLVTQTYKGTSILTYTAICTRNTAADDYYGDYDTEYYNEYECTKSKKTVTSKTRLKQMVTTKIVRTCCEGYHQVATYLSEMDAFTCVPIDTKPTERTSRGTETSSEHWLSTANDSLNEDVIAFGITDSTYEPAQATEHSWIAKHWPSVFIPLIIIIIAVVLVVVWRWTVIRIFWTGKYHVNGGDGTNQACSKMDTSNTKTATNIKMKTDVQHTDN